MILSCLGYPSRGSWKTHTLVLLSLRSTMSNDQRASTSHRREEDGEDEEEIREIHALSPPPPPANLGRRRDGWETHSRRSSSLSVTSTEAASVENFTTMSREFSALVIAGSSINGRNYSTQLNGHENEGGNNLGRIREEDMTEETNPLAIVPDRNPLGTRGGSSTSNGEGEVTSVQRVKKEEVEAKISAWQNAKIAKINNRFKREDVVISGWEGDQVQKATSWMKKVERKLEEKRARALEKMQNDIAKARRKAGEKRASAEGKRGTKGTKILEMANLMRAVGKFPAKRSFF